MRKAIVRVTGAALVAIAVPLVIATAPQVRSVSAHDGRPATENVLPPLNEEEEVRATQLALSDPRLREMTSQPAAIRQVYAWGDTEFRNGGWGAVVEVAWREPIDVPSGLARVRPARPAAATQNRAYARTTYGHSFSNVTRLFVYVDFETMSVVGYQPVGGYRDVGKPVPVSEGGH